MTDTNQEVRETPEALRALSDAATPGQAWCDGDTADVYFCDPPGSSFRPDSVLVARCATGDDYKRNARFIAECVNYVRAALASAPPPAVPDAVGVRVADEESAAKLIYEAMLWAREQQPDFTAPPWVEGGNSDAQYEARRFARKIAALSSIEPTPSPEQEPVMWICEFFSEEGSLLERRITEDRERLPKFVPAGSTLKITPLFATPSLEPQPGSLAARFAYLSESIAAVTTLPTPGDLYYAVKNDGDGTGWRYHLSYVTAEDIHAAALALRTPSPEPQAADALADMERRKDAAYEERNKVVAALAKLFPSGICKTDIPGWSDDWHGCVRIDLPTGQVSWHYHDSQAHLFADLPPYQGEWDGHDTQEKYRRLAALSPEPQASNAGAVEVNYDDFFAAYRYVPRSKMSPTSCLKTRLRSLLREEDLQHADEAEEIQAQDSAALSTPEPQTGERDGEVEPDYPDMEERGSDEPLEEALREILLGGQGDDDGAQIMPDFEEGQSVRSMLHACIALLETRRDVIEGYENTEAQLRHRLANLEERANAFFDANDAEPEKDCWDTETGEEEPGAQKFASDWSWSDYHERVQKARDALRAAHRAKPEAQAIVGKEGDQ